MSRRLLVAPLLVMFPALLCAQDMKLVNCRTLEAAGNFVGPDEVIVDDLVCQRVKAGTNASPAASAAKPVIGTVISDTDAASVVEAAKAASKRVSAAKEAIKEKTEQAGEEATQPATVSTKAMLPAAAPEAAASPVETAKVPEPAAPAAEPETASPAKSSAPATATTEVVQNPAPVAPSVPATVVPANVPEHAADSATESSARAVPAEPTKEPVVQGAIAPPAGAVSQVTSSREEVSAKPEKPESAAAPAPAVSPQSLVAPNPADVPAVPEAPKATAEAPSTPVADAPRTETSSEPAAPASGFSDANAGVDVIANPRPAEAKSPSADAAAKAAAEEAQAAMMAPDPNLPRDRVVQMGAFVQPRESGLDATSLAHKNTFQPGDIEGVEEGHRPECTKNITLGGLKGEQLVLGTPSWAAKWIEKNQKRMPDVCFSDTPMTSARNYLIVFYTSPLGADSAPAANSAIAPDGTMPGGVGGFTLNYGSTWHYAQDRSVGVTVLSRDEADEPQHDLRNVWHATAYTEAGVPVAEHWPEKPKKQMPVDPKDAKSKKAREALADMERVSDELLSEMVGDIAKL